MKLTGEVGYVDGSLVQKQRRCCVNDTGNKDARRSRMAVGYIGAGWFFGPYCRESQTTASTKDQRRPQKAEHEGRKFTETVDQKPIHSEKQ